MSTAHATSSRYRVLFRGLRAELTGLPRGSVSSGNDCLGMSFCLSATMMMYVVIGLLLF
jgi:hypothetical protein